MIQNASEPVRLGSAGLLSSGIGIGTWAIGGGWGPQSEETSKRFCGGLHTVRGCSLSPPTRVCR